MFVVLALVSGVVVRSAGAADPVSRSVTVGTSDREGLDFFVTLQDPVAVFVGSLYERVLARAPDQQGLDAWVAYLHGDCGPARAGVTIATFFGSAEFQSRALNPTELESALYRATVAREPEPASFLKLANHFLMVRRTVGVDGFIASAEFQRGLPDRSNAPALRALVTRYYEVLLGREAHALDGWVDYLQQTGDFAGVAAVFVQSGEFTNQRFSWLELVDRLYRGILGRPADPAGLAGWVGVLQADVVDLVASTFLPSPELQARIGAICQSP